MKFDNETRTRLIVTVTTDFDPADATLEVGVDGTWHPASWTDPAVVSNSATGRKWTRAARTVGYFAGPDVDPSGATALTTGRHSTETRVTSGADVIVATSTPIDVA